MQDLGKLTILIVPDTKDAIKSPGDDCLSINPCKTTAPRSGGIF